MRTHPTASPAVRKAPNTPDRGRRGPNGSGTARTAVVVIPPADSEGTLAGQAGRQTRRANASRRNGGTVRAVGSGTCTRLTGGGDRPGSSVNSTPDKGREKSETEIRCGLLTSLGRPASSSL